MGTKISQLTQISNTAANDLLLLSQDQGDTTYISKASTYNTVRNQTIQEELNDLLNEWRTIRGFGSSYTLMIQGWVDGFKDELGIDTVNSINQSYDSMNDLYKPTNSGTPDNMTLLSNVFIMNSVPNNAKITLFEQDVDSITLNTDIIASVSRDGGSNYTPTLLIDEGAIDGTIRLLSGIILLGSQPSDLNIKVKIETNNNKDLKLYGLGLIIS